MKNMTPEQEARYALDFGVARSDLPEGARLAYDRLVKQRARARLPGPAPRADDGADNDRVIGPGWVAWLGTALTFVVGQGGGIVLLPYAFTHWQPGEAWPLAVRALGVALITTGGIVVIRAIILFATEGVGALQPLKMPDSWRLTVGGPYRYVRNAMYLAIVMAVTGQALLLSRPVLLAYAAVLLAVFVLLVRFYEEPSLARRFGADYEAYRKQVPGWWPRWPRRNAIPSGPTRE